MAAWIIQKQIIIIIMIMMMIIDIPIMIACGPQSRCFGCQKFENKIFLCKVSCYINFIINCKSFARDKVTNQADEVAPSDIASIVDVATIVCFFYVMSI